MYFSGRESTCLVCINTKQVENVNQSIGEVNETGTLNKVVKATS